MRAIAIKTLFVLVATMALGGGGAAMAQADTCDHCPQCDLEGECTDDDENSCLTVVDCFPLLSPFVSSWNPQPFTPTYPAQGTPPTVKVDQTHVNFHQIQSWCVNNTARACGTDAACARDTCTAGVCDASGDPCFTTNDCEECVGSYRALDETLRLDGYTVEPYTCRFGSTTCTYLAGVDTLVIANARSAVSPDEAAAILSWVGQGGRFLLIGDHEPFPCAIQSLAEGLGLDWRCDFQDGFSGVFCDAVPAAEDCQNCGSLTDHPVSMGLILAHQVHTFSGSSFDLVSPAPASVKCRAPTLKYPSSVVYPESCTPPSAVGRYEAASLLYGQGRVYVMAEAFLFRYPGITAVDNQTYLLNVMHWLDGLLPVATLPSGCDCQTQSDTDPDADGVFCGNDCDPDDPDLWSLPGLIDSLELENNPMTDETTLRWLPPTVEGGIRGACSFLEYDTLRSASPGDFTAATCIEQNEGDRITIDPDVPLPGQVFYYRIRPQNPCGEGSAGASAPTC